MSLRLRVVGLGGSIAPRVRVRARAFVSVGWGDEAGEGFEFEGAVAECAGEVVGERWGDWRGACEPSAQGARVEVEGLGECVDVVWAVDEFAGASEGLRGHVGFVGFGGVWVNAL